MHPFRVLTVEVLLVTGIFTFACLAQTCSYPCVLQNGCTCNHTVTHQGADGQTYGTCTSCDAGWTGYNCGDNVSPCVNGGVLQPDGTCECIYSWTGAACGDQQCMNSVDGVGPLSIVPVNFSTNECDKCKPGYVGLACEMYTEDEQCPPDYLCYTDVGYHAGVRKVFDCEVTELMWIILFGEGRNITAKAKMQCENYLQNCYISIWREEPDNAWFDPFLYCTLSDGIVVVTQGVTNSTTTPMDDFVAPVRYTLLAIMLALLLGLFVVSKVRMQSSKRSVLFAAVSVILVAALAGQISFLSVYGHDEVTTNIVNDTMFSYQFEHTLCTCAKSPTDGAYTPFCDGSIFGTYYVPNLVGKSSLDCNQQSAVCLFSQQYLGGATIGLQCFTSECSNQTSGTPTYNIPNQKSTVIYAMIGIGVAAAVVIFSYIASRAYGAALAKEFHDTYDAESRQRSIPPQSPLNDEASNVKFGTSPLLSKFHARTVSYNSAMRETPPTETLHVVVRDLQYVVHGRQTPVLKGATFDFKSGEMVAIIGPSGAGKTTLLDILARREKVGDSEGTISVNGTIINSDNASSYRRMIGFVAQEDVLVPTLTVWETIYFAAKLKLPSSFPDSLVRSIVDSTINVLQLSSCANTLVGGHSRRGISGGEKRRVSIATELVANPRILFLDEPTSGLDSVSALDVMRTIVHLTKRPPQNNYAAFFDFQPAVVFSIHQPSSEICEMFDRILLVARGHILYSGAASEAVQRVATLAPQLVEEPTTAEGAAAKARSTRSAAEELLALQHRCTDEQCEQWEQGLQRDGNHMRPEHTLIAACVMERTAASLKYYPRAWEQVVVLGRRTWASLLGANYLLNSHAAATTFLSITLSLLYNQVGLTLQGTEDKAGMMTFLLLVIAFSSLSALDLFISEKKLFCSERENGYYSTGAYFIIKVLFDFIPLRIVPTLLLASSIYYPMGLRIDGGEHFLWFLFITTVFSLFVTGICFCVAIVTPSFGTAALVSALIILWHTVYGGLMLQSASIPIYMKFFKYFSPFYFGYEALMVNELEGQNCEFNPSNSEGSFTGVSVPIACQQFLFNLGLDPRNFTFDVYMLCAWTAGNLMLGFIMLALVRVKH